MNDMIQAGAKSEQGRVFELAAELFAVLATPLRLRVLSALCEREKSVNELLAEIETTQPNLSQHLRMLYRAGIVSRRRVGSAVFYRVVSQPVLSLCAAVCQPRADASAVAEAARPRIS